MTVKMVVPTEGSFEVKCTVFSCQLPVASCQLRVSCQSPVTSRQLPVEVVR
jgi:hypothetical protein